MALGYGSEHPGTNEGFQVEGQFEMPWKAPNKPRIVLLEQPQKNGGCPMPAFFAKLEKVDGKQSFLGIA